MTVRSRASASRNGIQRGRPPKPARKPSVGPLPFFQTREENPFSSTGDVSGSVTLSSLRKDAVAPFAPSRQPSPPVGERGFALLLRRDRRGAERRQLGPLGARDGLRPPAVIPFGEEIGHLRHHLLGE